MLASVARARDRGFISSHSLAETYSALTSLPIIPRITPAEAEQILEVNLRPHFGLVGLTSAMYGRAIDACVRRSLAGGKVYDALLLECARRAKCDRIYTFNVEDFRKLAPDLADRITAP